MAENPSDLQTRRLATLERAWRCLGVRVQVGWEGKPLQGGHAGGRSSSRWRPASVCGILCVTFAVYEVGERAQKRCFISCSILTAQAPVSVFFDCVNYTERTQICCQHGPCPVSKDRPGDGHDHAVECRGEELVLIRNQDSGL